MWESPKWWDRMHTVCKWCCAHHTSDTSGLVMKTTACSFAVKLLSWLTCSCRLSKSQRDQVQSVIVVVLAVVDECCWPSHWLEKTTLTMKTFLPSLPGLLLCASSWAIHQWPWIFAIPPAKERKRVQFDALMRLHKQLSSVSMLLLAHWRSLPLLLGWWILAILLVVLVPFDPFFC